jgi:hypothetical protein
VPRGLYVIPTWDIVRDIVKMRDIVNGYIKLCFYN